MNTFVNRAIDLTSKNGEVAQYARSCVNEQLGEPDALGDARVRCEELRHPSYGGAAAFRTQGAELLVTMVNDSCENTSDAARPLLQRTSLALKVWLVTFHPLCNYAPGIDAIRRFKLPPFIDGSCRREPDLESEFPSITALCRGQNFVPRLSVGDQVVYLTTKGRWGEVKPAHHRYVARLRIVERFENHETAAYWYASIRGLPVPRNLIVNGFDPLPYDQTHGSGDASVLGKPVQERLAYWNAGYVNRAARTPVTYACQAEFIELRAPPPVFSRDWTETLGRLPGTENPTSRPLEAVLELEGRLRSHASPTRCDKFFGEGG
jgi:hypothetical protein